MDVLVPFDAVDPNTRLGDVLSDAERTAFAEAMLADVLDTVEAAGHSPQLLTTRATERAVPETVDDRPLTEAVNAQLRDRTPSADAPVAVLMADLPLVTPATVRRLMDGGSVKEESVEPRKKESVEPRKEEPVEGEPADVTIAPGLGGGTNALVVREPSFRVDYHGASCRDHERIAGEVGASVRVVDSRRLGTDVDEPSDLAEVLLHAEGQAREWLRQAGFELATGDGRVTVRRTG